MDLILLNSILMMCLDGQYICERSAYDQKLKFYEPGKSCYIEGVFYESCPPRNYDQNLHTNNNRRTSKDY